MEHWIYYIWSTGGAVRLILQIWFLFCTFWNFDEALGKKQKTAQVSHISVCRKLWIPWHRAPSQIYYWIQTFLTFSNLQRFHIRKINQTGKYEADQTFHSANILVAPPFPDPRSHHAVVTPKSEPTSREFTHPLKHLIKIEETFWQSQSRRCSQSQGWRRC